MANPAASSLAKLILEPLDKRSTAVSRLDDVFFAAFAAKAAA